MTDNLPPSKFGAGYTYGGPPSEPPQPQVSQPAPAPRTNPVSYASARPPLNSNGSQIADGQRPVAYTYPASATPPGSATAAIGGVFALLSTGVLGWVASYSIRTLMLASDREYWNYVDDKEKALIIGSVILLGAATVLSFVGAVMLFSRARAAKTCLTLGFVCAITQAIVSFVFVAASVGGRGATLEAIFRYWLGRDIVAVGSILAIILPLVAMILARSSARQSPSPLVAFLPNG